MTTVLDSIFWILNLNQSQFFAKHSNQSVCFILYRHKITWVLFSCLSKWRNLNKRAFFPCILIFLLYKTNRFHVAVLLFSNRSQRTSKCGKNISDTLGCASCATFLFLPHFDVICDLLLNRRTATWNLFVNQISLHGGVGRRWIDSPIETAVDEEHVLIEIP